MNRIIEPSSNENAIEIQNVENLFDEIINHYDVKSLDDTSDEIKAKVLLMFLGEDYED